VADCRRVMAVIVSLSAVLAAMGCASSGPPKVSFRGKVNNRGTVSVPVVSGRRTVLEMEVADYSFKPTIVKVQVGTSLIVRLHNVGSVQHTFTIPSEKADVVLPPGGTHDLALRDFGAGQIPFRCRFHLARGMQGGFLVLAD